MRHRKLSGGLVYSLSDWLTVLYPENKRYCVIADALLSFEGFL